MRAILPPYSKFHFNGAICSWVIAKSDFQCGVHLPFWVCEFLNFCHVSVTWDKICLCTINFLKIGRFAFEIYGDIMIFNMESVRHLAFGNFWNFLKLQVSVAWVKICACTPNCVIFGRLAADIGLWTYDDFQNGGRPPCWIYCDVIILHRKTWVYRSWHCAKFWSTSVSYFLIYFNYHASPF